MANVPHETLGTGDLHVAGYMQDADPGAVGAGIRWTDTTEGSGRFVEKIRNVTDSGWEPLSIDPEAPPALGTDTPAAGTFTDLTITGVILGNTTLRMTPSTATDDVALELGYGRAGDGNAYIDLIGDATYPDFGLRVIRGGGANGQSLIQHRGTGALTILTVEAASLILGTNNTGQLTINSSGGFAFGGGSPTAIETGWTTFTNLSADRTCDANATNAAELADILGTLIEALKAKKIISA